jgi:CBS domain-containing protein
MICPDCGHDNLAGTDACEQCGQELASLDIPTPSGGLHQTLLGTPLREVGLHAPNVVTSSTSLLEAIRLMQRTRQGSVLVVDDGRLVGIFTERDVLNRIAGENVDLAAVPLRDHMTPDPQALSEDDALAFALHRMAVGHYRHVPVVRDGSPVGFLSVRGVLRFLARNKP